MVSKDSIEGYMRKKKKKKKEDNDYGKGRRRNPLNGG
jgi:hypothetical protein